MDPNTLKEDADDRNKWRRRIRHTAWLTPPLGGINLSLKERESSVSK